MRTLGPLPTLCRLNCLEFARDPVAAFFTVAFPVFFLLLFGVTDAVRQPFTFAIGVSRPSHAREAAVLTAELERLRLVRTQDVDPAVGLEQISTGRLSALILFEPSAVGIALPIRVIAPRHWQAMARLVMDATRVGLLREPSNIGRFGYRLEEPPVPVVSDFAYVFPGLIAMALMQLGLFATATPLLRARDRGTLRHLSTTPITPLVLLASQLLPRFALAALQLLLLLGLGRVLFDLDSTGSWSALYGVTALGALMLIATGYAVAGAAPGAESGMAIILLLNFAMLFLGQVFFDLSHVPQLRWLVFAVPLTYLTDLLRQIIIGTEGLLSPGLDIVALTGWTAAAVAIACRRFRFDMEPR